MEQVRSLLNEPKLREMADKRSQGTPEERVVEALFSYEARNLWPPALASEHDFNSKDQAKLPGRIAYLLAPDLPWSVVIRADSKLHRIVLEGYGSSLAAPMMLDSLEWKP